MSEWPQNRKRNHPLHCEMDTSRVDGVKAPQHRGTPRSRRAADEKPNWPLVDDAPAAAPSIVLGAAAGDEGAGADELGRRVADEG